MFGVDSSGNLVKHHMVVLPWFEGPLAMLPLPLWQRLEERWLAPGGTRELQAAKRVVCSRALFTHTDPEGRIALTPEHLAWLGIPPGTKDRLMVIGAASHAEVWRAETWAAHDAVTLEQYNRYLEMLIPAEERDGAGTDGDGGGGGS
jgi:DNA-binding transcriptional regulator/RsmH inhibitor MraZ